MNFLQKIFFFIVLPPLGITAVSFAQERGGLNMLPVPLHVTPTTNSFKLTPDTKIRYEDGQQDLEAIAHQLADGIFSLTGFKPVVSGGRASKNGHAIVLKTAADTLGDEGYRLSVDDQQILATGTKANGLFYACESILQLIPVAAKGDQITIPGVVIVDKPRFAWRGLMLDVGRYFYSVDYIKKFIDYLAMHKMNTFHWHLTEDHGWRIEIRKYPKLTSVGAWRAGTQYAGSDRIDPTPHGGFYTQEQVKEVVAYAQSKYVTVVPEIEMPGHSYAALVSYPELSCTGEPHEMLVKWGIQKDIYCAGKESTFTFLEDVLSEVAALFPGQFIHIGGDEAPKDRWKVCPYCQKRIKDERLKDEHELQSYFITRIEKFLETKGKRIIGWDEILEGGLAPNAAVMSWRGIQGGVEAAKLHHAVVMSPTTYTYLDYYQGQPYQEPYTIGGYLPLQKVYNYEPFPAELGAEEAKYILGVQANVWCEYIHSADYADYMTFPRGAAVAEVAWSMPANKDWNDFKSRMESQYRRYDLAGIHYAKSAYNVVFEADSASGKTISMYTDSYNPDIRYTTDGSEPTASSVKYEGPVTVQAPATVKAATFRNGKRLNQVSSYAVIR